ncbi:hypothetical protein C0J52_14313 [Blattella germanica]|nr:hypothetical protein C0J52_14313 [Blattella germanica]
MNLNQDYLVHFAMLVRLVVLNPRGFQSILEYFLLPPAMIQIFNFCLLFLCRLGRKPGHNLSGRHYSTLKKHMLHVDTNATQEYDTKGH